MTTELEFEMGKDTRNIFGLFAYADDTVEAIHELGSAGFADIVVFSPVPVHDLEHALEHGKEKRPAGPTGIVQTFRNRDFHVLRFTLIGAFMGLIGAWVLMIGTALSWRVPMGGMPIIALPPIGLISYEMATLAAFVWTVIGFLFLTRLPTMKDEVYDVAVGSDRFGIAVKNVDPGTIELVRRVMTQCGAVSVEEKVGGPAPARKKRLYGWTRTLILLVMVAVGVNAAIIGYGVAWTWIRSTGFNEQNTVNIKPQEPPGAGAVVAGAVPLTGPGLSLSTKNAARQLVNPIKPSAESLLRGGQGFKANCSPCHGVDGDGHGVMGAAPRLSPAPPDEIAALQKYLRGFLSYTPDIDASFALRLTDGELYWTITNGGEAIMPSQADALSPEARWDVINYIKYGLGDQRE